MSPNTRVLAATILGSSMAFIDASVTTVALPAMQTALEAGVAAMQWVLNAYLLTLGALVLIGGALGDRVGRVRVFVWGIVLFMLASAGCGLAPGAGVLVAARAVQGVGAALLVPSSLAILGAGFNDCERGAAIGTWSGVGALTTAIGPALGGLLVDTLGWRTIFFLNVPIAAAALWLARGIPESRDEAATGQAPRQTAHWRGLDWLGAVLAATGLGALTFGFIAAPDRGFGSAAVLGPVTAGVALLIGFLLREASVRTPMLPLHLFRSRTFSGANLLTLLLYFAVSGVVFFLPYTLVRAHGYSATGAGMALLPWSLLMGGVSRLAGRMAGRRVLLLTAGPALAAAGIGVLAWRAADPSYWTGVLPAMLLLGLGMAMAVAPLVTVVMGAAGPSHAGVASGINNAVARVAGLLAVATLGVAFRAAGDDFAAGFRAVAIVSCACAAASVVAAWVLIRPEKRWEKT